MKNYQENKLGMLLAVRDFLLQNGEFTRGLPNYDLNFGELQKVINEIQSISEVQKSDKKGFAKQKQYLRDELIKLVLDVSHKMTAFAKFSSNLMLQSETKMNRSTLLRSTDTGLRDLAQIIFNKAAENIESLQAYGVNAETQTLLKDAIDKYNASISGPRVAKTEGVQATKGMSALFDKADQLLENITIVIGIIRSGQPDFYNGFKTARKIVNTGTGSLSLKGTAVDSKKGSAIKGVRFVFTPDSSTMKGSSSPEIVKTTSEKGNFQIKSLAEGTYRVKVSKPGYKERVVEVVVADGDMTELRVELEAVV